MTEKTVIEIVVFVVSEPVAGLEASRAAIEDAKAYNNAIISAETYQAADNANKIAQRIVWRSLDEAKAAFAASESFPNMKKLMPLIDEQILFDYFYEQ